MVMFDVYLPTLTFDPYGFFLVNELTGVADDRTFNQSFFFLFFLYSSPLTKENY